MNEEMRHTSLLHNDALVQSVAQHESWTTGQWKAWERIKRDAGKLVTAGEMTDLFLIVDGSSGLLDGVTGVSAHPPGEIAALSSEWTAPILQAAGEVVRGLLGRQPTVDEERIAETRLLFSEQGYKMLGPRRVGDGKDLTDQVGWSAPYVAAEVGGGAVAAGSGRTPLEAAENAWAKFQANQRK